METCITAIQAGLFVAAGVGLIAFTKGGLIKGKFGPIGIVLILILVLSGSVKLC